ncbi:MAG: hypothetical protein R6V32_10515 [Bacteroidales bacterium]
MEANNYWKKYEAFCHSLMESNKMDISIELREAKALVNGLTDGWYGFLNRLKSIKKTFKDSLSNSESESLEKLIRALEENVKN